MTGMLSHAVAGMALAMACAIAPAQAQSISSDTAKMLAPTGTLRVGVLMVWYFALEDKASGKLAGVIPDLGRELARRAGVAAELIKLENPGAVMAAFRNNGSEVPDRIVSNAVGNKLRDDVRRRIGKEQGVAVGGRRRDRFHADQRATTGPVVDDDWLFHAQGENRSDRACKGIVGRACRVRHDDLDRFVGIGELGTTRADESSGEGARRRAHQRSPCHGGLHRLGPRRPSWGNHASPS